MGKLDSKKAHLSKINLLLEDDKKSKINWKNLEQANENVFRLKPSEDYDNKHLILGFIEEPDYIFLHVNIPKFINETDSVKSDIEKIKHLDTLIKKQLGVSISENLLYSFSAVTYTTEADPVDFLQSVWHVTEFKLKSRVENMVIFENKKDGLEYNISYDVNHTEANVIKHELVIDRPDKFLGVECAYKILECEQFHDLCEIYLNLAISNTKKISEIKL